MGECLDLVVSVAARILRDRPFAAISPAAAAAAAAAAITKLSKCSCLTYDSSLYVPLTCNLTI